MGLDSVTSRSCYMCGGVSTYVLPNYYLLLATHPPRWPLVLPSASLSQCCGEQDKADAAGTEWPPLIRHVCMSTLVNAHYASL
jgi:hypothetical protein